MGSSCCRNASAQLFRGTHIYAHINEYCWTINGACRITTWYNIRVVNLDARERFRKNTTFADLQLIKHILFNSCFVIETVSTCTVNRIYSYSAMETCLRSLIRTILLEFVSVAVFRRNSIVRKDTVCQVRTTNTKIRLRSKLN